ncbi:MAG: isochorismate synthase [Leptolyngbyaceae cyanobacterium T60_A2020_046]|nr:isochorismate synthase [Leptolyngbyaceae cyanobacterium T60_A2020_046]
MTVAPSYLPTLPSEEAILRVLKTCLKSVQQSDVAQIVSLSFDLPLVDPLAVLGAIASQQQRQYYLESPARGQAIAAWDSLIESTFQGNRRFQVAQQWIERWTRCLKPISVGAEQGNGPYFFCSFSFFDRVDEPQCSWAPGTVSLMRWQVVRRHQRCVLVANVLLKPTTHLHYLAAGILQQLRRVIRPWNCRVGRGSQAVQGQVAPRLSEVEAIAFKDRVNQALLAIRQGELQKQVVAHAIDVSSALPFQPIVSLHRLREQHPDCYIFALMGAQPTAFIGASPERLLSIREGRLVTDALAGSAPRGATPLEDRRLAQQLLNTPKEQREHQLVRDFIVAQLSQEGLRAHYRDRPQVLKLSHIQHLHTPICAEVAETVSPLRFVEALHPTPAVAGVPTPIACDLIRNHEPCDRGLYAAPFGWIDSAGNSEFIVSIRSARLQGNSARLYAGAGIVEGSDPDRELVEIQLKLRALAEVLG